MHRFHSFVAIKNKDIHDLIVFRMTLDTVNDWKREFSLRQIFGKTFVLLQLEHKTAHTKQM